VTGGFPDGVIPLKNEKLASEVPVLQEQKAVHDLLKSMEHYLDTGDTGGASTLSGTIEKRIQETGPLTDKLHFQLMRLYILLGKFQLALDTAERILNSFPEGQRAQIYSTMAQARENLGLPLRDVLNDYIKTAETAESAGDTNTAAESFSAAGSVCVSLGKKRKALSVLSKALTYKNSLSTKALARVHGNRRGECIILGNLGGALARFGQTADAIDTLETAIHIAEEIGHTRGVMTFHANIGLAYKQAGNYSKAEKHIRESMTAIEKSGDRRALAVCHLNLSGVLAKQWRMQEAVDEARRSLRFACTVNALTTQARALSNLGSLMMKTDRLEMALNFFREAYRRSIATEDYSMLSAHTIGESKCLLELNRRQEAMEKYKTVMELDAKYGMDMEVTTDLKELEEMLGITDG